MENYLDFFLIRTGRHECRRAMHRCVLERLLKKKRAAASQAKAKKQQQSKLHELRKLVPAEEKIEATTKLFEEEVDFEGGLQEGKKKLHEISLITSPASL